ncbi:testis-specific serine/threonine-protein kinase 4-like [Oppia nitens]|uniref:testis-specific serine/threonine-protein kinase 4-like n=1 Tax=Oppia nitens TaxID=1686743 RepID=UPI0023DB32DD|nr:testis-specific serine/threonine-protein kinase 4-like [Oppia nitens]
MGSYCCCCKGVDETNKSKENSNPNSNPKGPTDHKNIGNNGQKLFKLDVEDNDNDQKKIIEDEKLANLKISAKGGQSAYGKLKNNKKEEKKKALSASNYNSLGLVSKESKEFQIVREYLATKNYQLIESIGSGNYAEVYKVMTEKNRLVAVKVIDLTKTNDNYRIQFLPREVDIIRRLRHPGIIKTYEVSQTVNRIFMIMEFCSYGTVTIWLRDNGALPEPVVWEFITRILEGLDYMHSLKIAHRDLKLENILINQRLYPKLSDFSFSMIIDEKEMQSTTFCGSLPYFSPEILQRKPYNPFISDVWSLGVCFYVMICDGLPFKIDDDKQMLNKQLERDWDFKKRVKNKLSYELKIMIGKMLEPDVTKRATTQTLMNDPWIKTQPKPLE